MAKKDKELEVNVPESRWDGRLLTFIGRLLLQGIVFGVFAVIGWTVATSNIVGKGGPWMEDIQDPATLLMVILGAAIIGFGFCWAAIIGIKYNLKHTVISEQRMKFTAGTFNLFFNCIKWTFLSVITLGIYLLWVPVKVKKWKKKHTISYYDEADCEDEEGVVEYPITYYTVDDDGNYEEMTFDEE